MARFWPLLAALPEVEEVITQYALDVLRLYFSSKRSSGHFLTLRTAVKVFSWRCGHDTYHELYRRLVLPAVKSCLKKE